MATEHAHLLFVDSGDGGGVRRRPSPRFFPNRRPAVRCRQRLDREHHVGTHPADPNESIVRYWQAVVPSGVSAPGYRFVCEQTKTGLEQASGARSRASVSRNFCAALSANHGGSLHFEAGPALNCFTGTIFSASPSKRGSPCNGRSSGSTRIQFKSGWFLA